MWRDWPNLPNTVLDFVRLHPNWAALIVFVLAFGESLAFVSLILPFWAMLVGIGTIIGAADPLIFWTIVTAAAVGAALGDWLSYWLGYHYHEKIQAMWPLKDHPKLLENGPQVLQALGRVGRGDRPLLGAAARQRADRRRHHRDAVAQVSDRQLELGLPVGLRAALARHVRHAMVEGVFLLVGGASVRP